VKLSPEFTEQLKHYLEANQLALMDKREVEQWRQVRHIVLGYGRKQD
jgi:hypothetical protein